MLALAFLALVLLGTVAGAVACFVFLPLLPAIAAVIVGVPLVPWVALTLYGLVRRAQPVRPFDAAEQQRDAARLGGEGRHVRTADGRVVEYLVYGSRQPGARVVVQIHGAGSTAGWQCGMNAALCEELELKGIAPSMPGYGYSDPLPGRSIADFPRDLEAVLEAENVAEFMVEGTSLGTAHAMAVAWHFGPDRCVAMGLNVPYLPEHVCREFDLQHDGDKLPKTDARAWYQAWNFVAADLMYRAPLISPLARHMDRLGDGAKVTAERPWIFEALGADQRRLVVRGTQGQGWDQFSYDVNTRWGFDPREIETRAVAVWYAGDDKQCPPSHGEWLARLFESREGVRTSVRSEDAGFGHFTYLPSLGPAFRTEEETMPATLLQLVSFSTVDATRAPTT